MKTNTSFGMTMIIGISAFILSTSAHALTLDAENSHLSLLSTKVVDDGETSVTEAFTLPGLSGEVSDDGDASVIIDLSSIVTGIEKRDGRMREHLFNVSEYPEATILATVPEEVMEIGVHRAELDVELELHGEVQDLVIPVLVATTESIIVVNSEAPVLIDAFNYSMVDGLEKLAELAKVLHIPTTVPVSFSLQFDR